MTTSDNVFLELWLVNHAGTTTSTNRWSTIKTNQQSRQISKYNFHFFATVSIFHRPEVIENKHFQPTITGWDFLTAEFHYYILLPWCTCVCPLFKILIFLYFEMNVDIHVGQLSWGGLSGGSFGVKVDVLGGHLGWGPLFRGGHLGWRRTFMTVMECRHV